MAVPRCLQIACIEHLLLSMSHFLGHQAHFPGFEGLILDTPLHLHGLLWPFPCKGSAKFRLFAAFGLHLCTCTAFCGRFAAKVPRCLRLRQQASGAVRPSGYPSHIASLVGPSRSRSRGRLRRPEACRHPALSLTNQPDSISSWEKLALSPAKQPDSISSWAKVALSLAMFRGLCIRISRSLLPFVIWPAT